MCEISGNPSNFVENPSKTNQNDPKSRKIRPWTVFDAKSRPGRLQKRIRTNDRLVWSTFLVENVVARPVKALSITSFLVDGFIAALENSIKRLMPPAWNPLKKP